jgi:hypothetical protein
VRIIFFRAGLIFLFSDVLCLVHGALATLLVLVQADRIFEAKLPSGRVLNAA